jgi:DNA-directed RNA polymerase subunit H (RpoH/RPB5)
MRKTAISMLETREYRDIRALEEINQVDDEPTGRLALRDENEENEPLDRSQSGQEVPAIDCSMEEWLAYLKLEPTTDPYERIEGETYSDLRLKISLECLNKFGERVIVFWYPESKLGKDKAANILKKLEECDTFILIHNIKITPEAKSTFGTLPEGKHLDIFVDSELYVNITQHPLVPRHTICSEEQTNTILKKFSIQLKDDEYPGMPLILTTDPVVRFIGARPGQIIRITRNSWTQILPNGKPGKEITFRYVIKTAV